MLLRRGSETITNAGQARKAIMLSTLNCGGNPSISNTLLLQAKPLAQNVIAQRVIQRMLVIREPGQLSLETLVGIFAVSQVAMRLEGRRIHQQGRSRWQDRVQAVKDCEPVGIDERLEPTPHFELAVLRAQPAQKTQFHNLVQVRVHAIEQARFVGGIEKEQAHLIGDVVAPDHQRRVATGGIEFGQLLAQQNEDQAERETEWAALHGGV